MTEPIDWEALATAGAFLVIKPEECDVEGCTQPYAHMGRHTGPAWVFERSEADRKRSRQGY